MTQKDLDCLKKYLDIKIAHCNISETQAQDIYDMMRINCLEEPPSEEEIDRAAKEYEETYPLDDPLDDPAYSYYCYDGFKAGVKYLASKLI